MSKRRRGLVNAGLLAVSTLVAVLAGEVILRVTQVGHPRSGYVKETELYKGLLLKGKPGASFVNTQENRNLVFLNNWGFHDWDRKADSNLYRILFVGDSFVEGLQVPIDSLFTVQLEVALQQHGHAVEVLNAGFSGVGTAYQYLLWKEFFENRIEIDHVVLCFYLGNDLENNVPRLNAEFEHLDKGGPFLDEQGNVYLLSYKNPSPAIAFGRSLAKHSAVANTIYQGLYALRLSLKNPGRAHGQANSEGPLSDRRARQHLRDLDWTHTVNGTLRLIESWATELVAKDISFSIVLINSATYYANGYYSRSAVHKEEFRQRLYEWAKRENISFLELSFDGFTPSEVYSFDNDILLHFNFLGHRLVATKLFHWFVQGDAPVVKPEQ